MRLGLAGCGAFARNKHLRVLASLPEIEVVAVADPNKRVRDQTARQYGISRSYSDAEALLQHPGLEAIGVVVPSRLHADIALAALNAGKHVLIEKPLAATVEDGERILRAASESAARVVMGFHICFHRLIEDGLRMVAAGAVGEVESVRTLWCSPFWNPQEHGAISPEQMRQRHHEGALVDLAAPCFELWHRFTGQDVETIWAQSVDAERPEVAATVNARLTNDVLATGVFTTRTSHEIEIEVCGSLGRLRIGAERFDGIELLPLSVIPGSVKQRLADLHRLVASLPVFWQARCHGGIYLDSFARQWRHFAAVVRGREPVRCSVQDGFRALRATVAARESARTGVPVLMNPPSLSSPAGSEVSDAGALF